jgi:hypothetical protein
MNNNNNEAKNEKLREYLKTHNLDNLPITDLDDIYNKNFVKDSEKFNTNKNRHIDERAVKYGPSSINKAYFVTNRTRNPFDDLKDFSENETATTEKIVFSEPTNTNTFNAENHLTSDDIINYVPQYLPINGYDCTFNLTMMTIDGEPKFVVTYERPTDGWPCKTFYASTLRDVLNEVVLYAEEC